MAAEPTSTEIKIRVRELLGRATLLRARKERAEALKLAQEALTLDEESWEGHELVGDLLMEMNRGEQALESYRRARELNKSRPALEEKMGRAALARASRLRTAEMSEALLQGTAKPFSAPRKPAVAALFSLVIPGLGQLYNGQVAKGIIFAAVFLLAFGFTTMAVLAQVSPISSQGMLYAPRIDLTGMLSGAFSGVNAIWSLLLLGIYIYAVADAGLTASRSMTSDDTGLV